MNHRSIAVLTLIVVSTVAGCDPGLPDNVQVLPEQKLWVRDGEGREHAISADQLVGENSDESQPDQIFVLDRNSDEQRWIPVADFLQNQASAPRYLPVDASTQAHADGEQQTP